MAEQRGCLQFQNLVIYGEILVGNLMNICGAISEFGWSILGVYIYIYI